MADTLRADLDAFVVGDEQLAEWAGDDPIGPPPDADRANRMLRAVAGLERDATEVEQVADAEISRIREWRDDRLAGMERQRDRLAQALEQYARAVGSKTLQLPNGTLKLRAARERVVIDDEAAFLAWVEASRADRVRRTLADHGRVGLEAGNVGELVDRILVESGYGPLVAVKITPHRSEIKRYARPVGEPAEDDTVQSWVAVLDGGEIVPGVIFERSAVDDFTVTIR